jgi:hypothetical protein
MRVLSQRRASEHLWVSALPFARGVYADAQPCNRADGLRPPLIATLGITVTLSDAILDVHSAADDLCIVAKRPWTPDAECELVSLTDDYRVPEMVKARGYEYFLEVSVAKEELLKHAQDLLTSDQRVAVVIYYAEFDATPEWFNDICRAHLSRRQ